MAEDIDALKMAFCPKFSADNELCVFSAAASLERYKLNLKKQRLETSFSLDRFKG
jgi:hypothetical protein